MGGFFSCHPWQDFGLKCDIRCDRGGPVVIQRSPASNPADKDADTAAAVRAQA
jgi:hypothetical protein